MDNLENYFDDQRASAKHSGLGIASFIIAMLSILIYIGCFAIAFSVASQYIGEIITPEQFSQSEMGKLSAMVLLFFVGMLANLTGIGLGIAGVVQKFRKKVFGTLGLIFNSLGFLGIVGLFIMGLAMNGAR